MKELLNALVIGLIACGVGVADAAEVTRAQFKRTELDFLGYPTNAALAADLGRSEARRDLSNGVVQVPIYGLPSPESGEYHRILEQRYKVGSFGLAGCDVSDGLLAYASGYSKVSRAHVEQKHGTNIWKRAWAEAERACQAEDARKYLVRPGDTVSAIARKHGVSIAALTNSNPSLVPSRIKVGQIIILPDNAKP